MYLSIHAERIALPVIRARLSFEFVPDRSAPEGSVQIRAIDKDKVRVLEALNDDPPNWPRFLPVSISHDPATDCDSSMVFVHSRNVRSICSVISGVRAR